MKSRIKQLSLLFFCLLLLLFFGMNAYAAGSGNLDGGGGGMGNGTQTDVWRNQDGVRITVVTTDGGIASTPFDLTNSTIPSPIISFGKVCKLQYCTGRTLAPSGTYTCSKPGIALPRIISGGSSRANIETIKRYFCSEYAAELVSSKTGISFDELTSGSYKLVIEPIAYFVHGGQNYAMTATEAALYNQISGGTLRSKLPSLTHQNLPLSIFLEKADLGYPAWNGTISGRVSDSQIISALGIGIVTYKELPKADLDAPDHTYRVDTDVITSITLSSDVEVNPKNPASVTFYINGSNYTVNDIVMPEGGSQVVWAKWHTPMEPCQIPITVSVSGASTGKTSFVASIVSLDENPPPDPMATDTNFGFSTSSLPDNPQKTEACWSVWSASWHAFWQWESDWSWEASDCSDSCAANCPGGHGDWIDHGEWVDHGWYDFTSTSYAASITGSMEIHPDDIVPTAVGDTMKSGYGIKEDARASFSANAPGSHYAPVQTAVSYFPEFSYETYWRLLESSGGSPASFTFKPNEFSTYGRKVHFTPIWYPDDSDYTVYTYILDAWTPSGMLSVNVTDDIFIQGNMYDDWYSKRE